MQKERKHEVLLPTLDSNIDNKEVVCTNSEVGDSVYVTIDQAAEISGYDSNWIWRLARFGKIRTQKVTVEKHIVRQVEQIFVSIEDVLRRESQKRGPKRSQ